MLIEDCSSCSVVNREKSPGLGDINNLVLRNYHLFVTMTCLLNHRLLTLKILVKPNISMIHVKVFALAVMVLMPVFAFGAPKKSAVATPQISDREVVPLLTTSEVLEWERAKELEKTAQSQIATGERLINRPPSFLKTPAEHAEEKEAGKTMVEEGKANLARASEILDRLRQHATALQASDVMKDDTVVYPFEFSPEVLDDAIFNTVEKLLFNLWNNGYGRIYFGGAYFMDTASDLPVFIQDPILSAEMRRDIIRLDGTRFTFVGDEDTVFSLKTDRGRTVIDFPERSQILRHFKSAFIIAELIYDSRTKSALLSMRAIDLTSMNLASAELAVIAIDDKLLQLVAANAVADMDASESETAVEDKVASTKTVHAAANNEPTEKGEDGDPASTEMDELLKPKIIYKRFAVQMKDNKNFLKRVSDSENPFIFSFKYLGDTKGFESRAASMISKMILLQNSLNVAETDFLPLILQYSEGEAGTEMLDMSNAIWKVTPLSSGRSGVVAYDIEAISLLREEPLTVSVGLLQTALLEEEAPRG